MTSNSQASFANPGVSLSVSLLGGVLCLMALGCNISKTLPTSDSPVAATRLRGKIFGGQQPVAHALLQLYEANATMPKGLSNPLLPASVFTDAAGTFEITGDYTCSGAGTLVYIVASGGNPGLGGTVNNTALTEMAVLGTCGSLSSSTYVSLNELTTIAAVEALSPFMSDYTHVGSSVSNKPALAAAFANAIALVDSATGRFRNPTVAGAVLVQTYDTLASIIAACVNTNGGVAGDGSICGKLFLYTTAGATSDTVQAALHMVQLPAHNVASLFALVTATAPFQPVLTTAPDNFIAPVGSGQLAATNNASTDDAMTLDSAGNIWLLQCSAETLYEFDSSLVLLRTVPMATSQCQLTADPFGNIWVTSENSAIVRESVAKIGPDGTFLSSTEGYPFTDTQSRLISGGGIASDPSGNIWTPTRRTSDRLTCFLEFSNDGTILSPPGGYCNGASTEGAAIGTDGSGNAYLFCALPALIQKVNSAGVFQTAAGGYTPPNVSNMFQPVVFDPVLGNFWVKALSTTQAGLATSFSTDLTRTGTNDDRTDLPGANGWTTDGAGNLWIAGDFQHSISEVAPDHTVLSPTTYPEYYGYTVAGYGLDSFGAIVVDKQGNIIIEDLATNSLVRVPGLAAARD